MSYLLLCRRGNVFVAYLAYQCYHVQVYSVTKINQWALHPKNKNPIRLVSEVSKFEHYMFLTRGALVYKCTNGGIVHAECASDIF